MPIYNIFKWKYWRYPEITVASNNLKGGKIEIRTLQDINSNDILLTSIPSDLLYTPEISPQITVRTNGILATSWGDCSYVVEKFDNYPTITKFNLVDSVLEIEMINAEDKTLEDFSSVRFFS